MIEPFAQGLLQVVIRPAERGIAAREKSSCSRCRARPARRGMGCVARPGFLPSISRSRSASSGLAQIAFSTGRLAVAQLKLGLLLTAISAPSRSSSSASDL